MAHSAHPRPLGQRRIIVIVGPTSSGKSDLAVALARRHNGEVISADSRQVYRGLDIGSGKVSGREMGGIPHHILDVASPQRTYSVVRYERDAKKAIAGIFRRNRVPIICGGTGFYIQALVDGIRIPDVPPSPSLRQKLSRKSAGELFTLLKRTDPNRACSIDPKNKMRLIRALEIASVLGEVPQYSARPLPYPSLFLGIAVPDDVLRQRIERRIVRWLRSGLLAEVRRLRASRISDTRIRSFGLVYSWTLDLALGLISRNEFLAGLARDMGKYVRRQRTWFRRDSRIHWVRTTKEALALADQFLKR